MPSTYSPMRSCSPHHAIERPSNCDVYVEDPSSNVVSAPEVLHEGVCDAPPMLIGKWCEDDFAKKSEAQ